MIVNLRGTSGSGKSWVVQQVLAKYDSRPVFGCLGSRRPEAYEVTVNSVKHKLYVLGPYDTAGGGCDSIQNYSMIPELIKKYAGKGHVLFEGLLIGNIYGAIGVLLDSLHKKVPTTILALDTPLEQCIANIKKRRLARGDDSPYDPVNTVEKFKRYRPQLREKFKNTPWLDVTAKAAPSRIRELLLANDEGVLLKGYKPKLVQGDLFDGL